MSSTPEAAALVLHDDRSAPEGFDDPVPAGGTMLVATGPADEPVGVAVLDGSPPALRLLRLWVRPELRRQGHGRALLALVRTRVSAGGGAVLAAVVESDDAAAVALAAGTKVLGELMTKPLTDPAPLPRGFGWRPMRDDEFGAWREMQVAGYARESLERSGGDLAVALERSRTEFAGYLPQGLDTPGTTIVLLTAGEVPVGHLWLAHHLEPGLSFVYDVEVAPEHRGRGFGRAAMTVAEVLAREAGDERIGLHVFGGNATARRLYLSLGYRVRSTNHNLLAPA